MKKFKSFSTSVLSAALAGTAFSFILLSSEVAMSWDAKNFKKPDDTALKTKLDPIQYKVTQHEGTERPFDNPYWDKKEAGLYVDIVSGEPLFTSLDKYDSGTGWPSFTKPVVKENVVTKTDKSLFMARTEARSKHGDSHLGHIFDDGPKDKGGLRYCMNSASLRFIPVAKLKEEGYGEFLPLFEKAATSAGAAKK